MGVPARSSGAVWRRGERSLGLVVRRGRGASVRHAFTMLEVLIAMMVFFLVTFAVLQMVTVGLGAARTLQIRHADAGMLAAELSMTNSLEEGSESGDFGDLFPDSRWERQITEVSSNGLYQVDFLVIQRLGKKEVPTTMSILMYRPGSARKVPGRLMQP